MRLPSEEDGNHRRQRGDEQGNNHANASFNGLCTHHRGLDTVARRPVGIVEREMRRRQHELRLRLS